MMPEDGLDADPRPRRDLLRRGRLPERARPRVALGLADPDAARFPAVRQPAAGAADAGDHVAARRPRRRRHRLLDRAREHRGRVLLGRRPHVRRHRRARSSIQESIFTRRGVDRILRYAFELARSRPKKHLTSATKSNGIAITMPYWDERVKADVRRLSRRAHRPVPHRHPGRALRAAPRLVRRRRRLESVRRHPLRPRPGDDRHDRHRAVGNLNPEREFPSLFEPVHGSAPDIAGKASPIRSARSGRAR